MPDDFVVFEGDEGGFDEIGFAKLVDKLSFFSSAEGLAVDLANGFGVGGFFLADGNGFFGQHGSVAVFRGHRGVAPILKHYAPFLRGWQRAGLFLWDG